MSNSNCTCTDLSLFVLYLFQIYVHIPGSEKLTLELPLVIGTIPFTGLASRTNSMSSQEGSSATSSSLVSMPSAPPSYSEIPLHACLDPFLTPLLGLDDYSEDDCPIFMHAREYHQVPPPAYTEVCKHVLKHKCGQGNWQKVKPNTNSFPCCVAGARGMQ